MARQPSRFSTGRHSQESRSAASVLTSKVPVSLPKRLLFPHLPPGSELPPLLTCSDPQLNAELYEFLALALRGFVSPWWTKITRHDKEFLPEITRIVAIFLREFEARVAAADLPTLVFRDIPNLVSQHYIDYRNAAAKVGTSYATGGSATLSQIFHQMQPHMAIAPDGRWNEAYIRQAVEHVMKSCLPTVDWEAEAERAIVREILTRTLLGNVFQKVTQPWFIHKTLLDFLGPPPNAQPKPPDPPSQDRTRKRFTFQSLVIFFLSTVQTISGLCLTAIALSQRALQTFRSINSSSTRTTNPRHANLSQPIVDTMAEILTMRSRVTSSSLLSLVVLCIGFSRAFVDRALPHVFYHQLATIPRITKIIIQGKQALFPNGYPGPVPPDPTPEEQLILREKLEVRLLTLLPSYPALLLLGSNTRLRRRTVTNAIEPLSAAECNIHLFIMLFDVILLALFPEMGIERPERSFAYTEENLADSSVI